MSNVFSWLAMPGYELGKMIGGSAVDSVIGTVTDAVESADERKTNEVNFRKSTNGLTTLLNFGGGIAGALGGWKLGENFGTVGKVVGGVGLALVGFKLGGIVKEVGTDVAAAQDYAREAENNGAKGNFGKALWNNLANFGGQTYDGVAGSEVESPDL